MFFNGKLINLALQEIKYVRSTLHNNRLIIFYTVIFLYTIEI